MRRPSRWQVERLEALAHYRVFSVSALHARRDRDGHAHTFFKIEASDWVNVVALTPEDEFVMVRQFRLGSGTETLEIPGGMVDAGETPRDTAARELLEETGYVAEHWLPIGTVNPNPALYGNTLHTYLARGCRRVAEIVNDDSEETIVELVPRSRVQELAQRGAVDHALVLAAFYWLGVHEAAKPPTP